MRLRPTERGFRIVHATQREAEADHRRLSSFSCFSCFSPGLLDDGGVARHRVPCLLPQISRFDRNKCISRLFPQTARLNRHDVDGKPLNVGHLLSTNPNTPLGIQATICREVPATKPARQRLALPIIAVPQRT